MTKYLQLGLDVGGDRAYALVRADRGVIERWQPLSKTWIPAEFDYDEVYGTEKRFAREITEEQAQRLMTRQDLVELSLEALMRLRAVR